MQQTECKQHHFSRKAAPQGTVQQPANASALLTANFRCKPSGVPMPLYCSAGAPESQSGMLHSATVWSREPVTTWRSLTQAAANTQSMWPCRLPRDSVQGVGAVAEELPRMLRWQSRVTLVSDRLDTAVRRCCHARSRQAAWQCQ